jgi:CHAT domain-containing protein
MTVIVTPHARNLTLFVALLYFTVAAKAQDAESFFDAGRKYDQQEQYDSALVMYQKARELFTPGSLDEAVVCHALGDIYKYVLYDFDKAEVNYETALAIQQKLNPSDVKNLTRLYYNLATTNRSQRDHETAITWCLKAVDGCKTMNDKVFLERAYSIAGNIYRDMHEFDSAVFYYKSAVDLNNGRDKVTLAGLIAGWGETNYLQKDLDNAAKKLSFAADIYSKTKNVDKAIYFHTLLQLAEIVTQLKGPGASSYLKKAGELLKQLNIERGGPPSAFYKVTGDLAAKQSDNLSAYVNYQKSLQATTTEPLGRDGNPKDISQIDFKSYAYDALLGKARVTTGNKAMDCYAIAEKIMIASRAELDTQDARWNYIDANYRLYENIMSSLYQIKDRDESTLLHFMESSKSKSLADALAEVELKKALGKNDTLLKSLRNLRERSLVLQHQIDQKNESKDRDELIAIGQKISNVETAINTKYPSYIKTKYESFTVSAETLKEKLASLDAVLVEYFWGEENVYAIVISDSVDLYKLKTPELSEYLELFERKSNQYSEEAVKKFRDESYSLYTSLIQPFKDRLNRKRLIIVPDGQLLQLPFETLVTETNETSFNKLPYLLNDYVISYSLSASQLTTNPKQQTTNPKLLAFGFSDNIAGSKIELEDLAQKFPSGKFLFANDVTEKNFKDNASNFDLLHLAVHGSGDTGKDYSATLYFRDKDGPEDGHLYWYELYNMNLRASLAVLSSCESGIGKTYRGEGMLSMANAFTFAGCNNIVMGLWKVDDQVSVKLMNTFYTELLNGMAIDEALAMAKRTYLASADQISANPKLWGSLIAYGETPILTADKIPTTWVVIALTILAGAIVLLVVKTRKK